MALSVKIGRSALDGMGDALHEALSLHVEATGNRVLSGAQDRAPVDTGALRASGVFDLDPDNDLAGEAGFTAEYAPHVELGTVHQAAQPYLSPAVEEERQAFVRGIAQIIKEAAEGG